MPASFLCSLLFFRDSPSVICLQCWPRNNASIEKHNQPSSRTWFASGIAGWLARPVFRKIEEVGGRGVREIHISRACAVEERNDPQMNWKKLSALERWLTTHPEAQQSKGQEHLSSDDTDLKLRSICCQDLIHRLSNCTRNANTFYAR